MRAGVRCKVKRTIDDRERKGIAAIRAWIAVTSSQMTRGLDLIGMNHFFTYPSHFYLI